MDFKNVKIEDVINWCKENGQVKWLKETASKQVEQKRYPRVKGADGKYHADKTAEPHIVITPITTFQVITEWRRKFFPESFTGKEKKPTFHDLIKEL